MHPPFGMQMLRGMRSAGGRRTASTGPEPPHDLPDIGMDTWARAKSEPVADSATCLKG
jgi:hypothetical protein